MGDSKIEGDAVPFVQLTLEEKKEDKLKEEVEEQNKEKEETVKKEERMDSRSEDNKAEEEAGKKKERMDSRVEDIKEEVQKQAFQKEMEGQRIVVQGGNTVINITPTFNMQLGPSFTQVTGYQPAGFQGQHAFLAPGQGQGQPCLQAPIPSRDLLYPLYKSQRVLSEDDIDQISKQMGKGWKDVGSRLMFNWSQLEQFEQDTSSLSQAAFKMLYRWIQWKDERATVGKLTKALFMSEEFDAIRVLHA
ncbi:uncharacterized protein LOC111695858 isoform X2 [Eurytemora carolleeae]|uniref:uncharacterized protein LOC111695858 isoform X2 n=1 Tax=Eurytemora carolleeae TaxID=1294199 RepID=UPI000C79436C|nr:uncharacterized protein LOC111695858 isoform X2 [Eurytemora carolleeae]|eukprot:XP_023321085.1 uncharacterized protein LOC111695858 isoform X2 [Eurytemora affinis]